MREPELFPDDAREADRAKRHKREARKVGARMRLADDTTDMQEFVLRIFRERGHGDLHFHTQELAELCGGSESEEFMGAFMRLLRTVWDMTTAGILWRQDWPEFGQGVSTWGIRGIHSKGKMMRAVRAEQAADVGRTVVRVTIQGDPS